MDVINRGWVSGGVGVGNRYHRWEKHVIADLLL